jgi:PAS domain-containing protein
VNVQLVIISFSVLLQSVSALLAVRLLVQPGRRLVGFILLTAISLMAFRRVVTLWRLLTENAGKADLLAEIIALTISLLFLIGIVYITRLLKAREKTAETLRSSEERYHGLFSQSPDGILLIDTGGNIVDFNEAAHSRLGYSREEFAKLNLSDIDAQESREEIQASIHKGRFRTDNLGH